MDECVHCYGICLREDAGNIFAYAADEIDEEEGDIAFLYCPECGEKLYDEIEIGGK